MKKNIQLRGHTPRTALESLDPEELKSLVRDVLVSMKITEREDFIYALEAEMCRANFNIRAYLVPLGILAQNLDDLTPTEVGHLIRFLKMIVPQAMPAVERVTARYGAFVEKLAHSRDLLAA
jgi:hypothetical protein